VQQIAQDACAVDPKTASIVGRMTADDLIESIEINGVNIAQAGADFAVWRELIVTDHLVAGTNTLRIVVKNNGPAPIRTACTSS
jgi:hypothetical protein